MLPFLLIEMAPFYNDCSIGCPALSAIPLAIIGHCFSSEETNIVSRLPISNLLTLSWLTIRVV